jgi:hypothetical protein
LAAGFDEAGVSAAIFTAGVAVNNNLILTLLRKQAELLKNAYPENETLQKAHETLENSETFKAVEAFPDEMIFGPLGMGAYFMRSEKGADATEQAWLIAKPHVEAAWKWGQEPLGPGHAIKMFLLDHESKLDTLYAKNNPFGGHTINPLQLIPHPNNLLIALLPETRLDVAASSTPIGKMAAGVIGSSKMIAAAPKLVAFLCLTSQGQRLHHAEMGLTTIVPHMYKFRNM